MTKSRKKELKRTNWASFWIGLTAFVVVSAVLVGVMGWRTDGFNDWTFGFGEKQPVVNELEEEQTNSLVVTALHNDGYPVGLSVEPKASSSTDRLPASYTITVKVKPDDATVKDINFVLEWAGSENDEWDYTDKNVEDYVSVYQNDVHNPGENGRELIVSGKAPFGEQIHLKITSRSNPEVSAVCTIDYVKRIKDVTVKFVDESGAEVTEIDIAAGKRIKAVAEYTYDIGTVEGVLYVNRTYLTLNPDDYVYNHSNWQTFRQYSTVTKCFDWNEYVEFVPLVNGRYEEAEDCTAYIDLSMLSFLFVSEWDADDYFADPNDNPTGYEVTADDYFNYLKNEPEAIKRLKQVWYATIRDGIGGRLSYRYLYNGSLVSSSYTEMGISFDRDSLITPVTGIETTTPGVAL